MAHCLSLVLHCQHNDMLHHYNLWDQSIEGGYCWLNFTQVGLVMGAWSATMDFVLAILRK
jgi:hypothetical protein